MATNEQSTGPVSARRMLYRFNGLSGQTAALLVVDMQVAFVEAGQPAACPDAVAVIPAINRLAKAVRECGGKVVFLRHTMTRHGPGRLSAWQWDIPQLAAAEHMFKPGRPEHEVDPGLAVFPQDYVVDKYRYSALAHHSSDLNQLLEDWKVDTVLIAGVLTNCCCETTARDASMLGYKTVVAADAMAAMTTAEHEAALRSLATYFCDVRTTGEIAALLRNEPAAD